MPQPTALDRASERITRLCGATEDPRALRLAVLDEIRGVVPFDAYVWMATDPETEVGGAPLADVPCLSELPRLIRLKYLTPVNRWTQLDEPVATLRGTCGEQPEHSLVWRDVLHRYGVTDVASMVFRDRFGCWGFLDLWRIGPGTRFTDAEAHFLTSIAEPVTSALRRGQARTFDVMSPALNRDGPVVLVLTPDLEVSAQTSLTDEYLRTLVPPAEDRPPIPSAAYNVAAQLLAVEAGVDDHQASVRVHLTDGVWLTLRAARIIRAGPTAAQDIAVTIELTPPVERVSLFALACGLSRRETELLECLVTGADTRSIARQMFLSEHTVQDHLKSIFAKSDTPNRRVLLSRALGS